MAVAIDKTTNATPASSVLSITWTHTPVGTPTALGITTYGFATGSSADTATATYNGLTVPVADNTFDSTPDICYIFGLANPPAGPQTVVISFSNANYPVASSITVTGSDTTTCFSHTNHNSGSSASTTVTCTSATGELVLDTAGCDGSGALIVSGPQTAYMDGVANGGETVSASTTAGAATVTPTYTLSSAPWAAVVASFKAAAGGTGIAVWPYRM